MKVVGPPKTKAISKTRVASIRVGKVSLATSIRVVGRAGVGRGRRQIAKNRTTLKMIIAWRSRAWTWVVKKW